MAREFEKENREFSIEQHRNSYSEVDNEKNNNIEFYGDDEYAKNHPSLDEIMNFVVGDSLHFLSDSVSSVNRKL